MIAAAAGAATAVMVASRLPPDKFIWTGLVLAPFFVLVEAFIDALSSLFDGNAAVTRMMLASAIVAGFYGAWFLLHAP